MPNYRTRDFGPIPRKLFAKRVERTRARLPRSGETSLIQEPATPGAKKLEVQALEVGEVEDIGGKVEKVEKGIVARARW